MGSRRSSHLIKDCVQRCSHSSLLCLATFVALCYFSWSLYLKTSPFGGLTSNSVYRVGRSTAFSRYLHTSMNTCYHYELLTSHAGWSLYYSSADLITFILWNCSYHLSETLTTSFAISLVRFETISQLVTNLQLVTLLITKLGTKYTFKLQMSNDLTTMVCQKKIPMLLVD
jgi:hypothetical protein